MILKDPHVLSGSGRKEAPWAGETSPDSSTAGLQSPPSPAPAACGRPCRQPARHAAALRGSLGVATWAPSPTGDLAARAAKRTVRRPHGFPQRFSFSLTKPATPRSVPKDAPLSSQVFTAGVVGRGGRSTPPAGGQHWRASQASACDQQCLQPGTRAEEEEGALAMIDCAPGAEVWAPARRPSPFRPVRIWPPQLAPHGGSVAQAGPQDSSPSAHLLGPLTSA